MAKIYLRPSFWFVIVTVILILGGGGLVLGQIETSLILFPSPPYMQHPPPTLPAQSVMIPGPGDSQLHAWIVSGKAQNKAILMAHGNAGDLSSRAALIETMWRVTGATIMMFDYRGYGRSTGKANVRGLIDDGHAAQAWLAKESGLKPEQIFFHGRSLGGGVVANLANRQGAAGLILENTFSSLVDMAKVYYPLLPAGLLLREPLDSAKALGRWQVIQFHAEDDRVIPLAVGQRLHKAIRGPKELITGPGLDHNDMLPASWYEKVGQFIEQHASANSNAAEK